ncbi:MAG: hypothetical protein D4R64_16085 [Porphyromonadaceae bacterium]|nr:MAG: hypothetical protein D4R64_16085 [Porphyromonadaceae bacterium]
MLARCKLAFTRTLILELTLTLSIDKYVKMHLKSNPSDNEKDVRERVIRKMITRLIKPCRKVKLDIGENNIGNYNVTRKNESDQ